MKREPIQEPSIEAGRRLPGRAGPRAALVRVLGGAAGALLSALLASTAFVSWNLRRRAPLAAWRFSLGPFLERMPRHLHWLLPFMGLTALTLVLRAVQWQRLLDRPVPFRERYHFVSIGALVHNALPGKMGDVTRAFLLARTQALPFAQSLGAVAVAKLLELVGLLLLVGASLLGPFGQVASRFDWALRLGGLACALLLAAAVLVARRVEPLARSLERRGLRRLQQLLLQAAQGLGAARSAPTLGRALLFSLPPVVTSALAYGLALSALGVHGGIWAGPVLLGAIALGQSVVVIPAGMGLYYFVTALAARALGASAAEAAGFALLTHVGSAATQVALGLGSLWARKLRLSELRVPTATGYGVAPL